MAGLILCRSKYADRPYYISNMAINIYSLEELCYYIYNNIYLVGTDLFDEGMINFIDKSLGEEELAKQLEFITSQNAGLSELVMTVLRYVDYYSDSEIEQLAKVIEELDTQNVSMRLKARADNFLVNKRYNSAIRNYESIVYSNRDSGLLESFYGDVWHNMGVAYAGMYAFYEARECFCKAYELNNNDESFKEMVAAECLSEKNSAVDIEDEQRYVTYREIETIMDHAIDEPGYDRVKQIFIHKTTEEIVEYNKAVANVIDEWKAGYRSFIK